MSQTENPNESSSTDSEENETEEEEEEEVTVDARLQKSVDLLIKQTKIDKKKLEGLSLEEQFDRLNFLLENLPKPQKSKNKPVVPLPTDTNELSIGRKIKDVDGRSYYLFKPEEFIKRNKK